MTISAIIPAYNAGALLLEALDSVASQTRKPDEIILVDDGSNDGSIEIACNAYPLVRCVRQANGGVSAARNAGIAAARSEWIAFLDADDQWLPDTLASHAACVEKHPNAWVVGGMLELFCVDAMGGFEPTGYRRAHIYLGAKLIRREAFTKVGPFDPKLRRFETLDWLGRASEVGIGIVTHENLVLHYRRHNAGLTSDSDAMRRTEIQVVRSILRRRHGAQKGLS